MNFSFSDEQDALRDSVREFLAARYPVERAIELADGDGFDPATWPEVAELGWAAIDVPEDAGGAGLGFVEEAIVLEEAARTLFPGPLFSTVALARPALTGEDLAAVASGGAAATLAWAEDETGFPDAAELSTRAEQSANGWRLTGRKRFVPNLGSAGLVVVVAAEGVFVVDRDAEGVTWEQAATVDLTRPLGTLTLEEATGRPADGDPRAILEDVRLRGAAACAVEAVGVAQEALDRASAHAGSREQFGRAIGSFQAVSHQLADAFMDVEAARSLAYWASWSVADGAEDGPRAASTAKAFATEAATLACERAIQIHGGIGFTWEAPLHRFYKRALWLEGFLGRPREHRAAVAASLLD